MIYFTGDLHIDHKNILAYDWRPFSSLEAQEEYISRVWNTIVTDQDTVYIVGDFCLNSKSLTKLKQFTGRKIYIVGNHDPFVSRKYSLDITTGDIGFSTDRYYNLLDKTGCEDIKLFADIKLEEFNCRISHIPHTIKEKRQGRDAEIVDKYTVEIPKGYKHLHAHLHGKYLKYDNSVDIGFPHHLGLVSSERVIEILRNEKAYLPSNLTRKHVGMYYYGHAARI